MSDFGLTDKEMARPLTKAGCAVLLSVAAAFDPRVVPDEGAATGWWLVLGDSGPGCKMRAGDALYAVVEFYQGALDDEAHRPRLDPGHLVAIVDGWRQQHVQAGRPGEPPLGGKYTTVPGHVLAGASTTPPKALPQNGAGQ
jgi:hypothetical protein